jgi:hypothetical protein
MKWVVAAVLFVVVSAFVAYAPPVFAVLGIISVTSSRSWWGGNHELRRAGPGS